MLDQLFPAWQTRIPEHVRCGQVKANELLLTNFLKSGTPSRYHGACASDFIDMSLEDVVGKSLFLHGTRGSGKTHMAVALQKEWMWAQICDRMNWNAMTSAFISVSELMMKLRASFGDKTAPQEGELIERLCCAPLLILDDLGTQQGTDYAFNVLYVIINERYNWNRTTIVTGNDSLEELNNRFNEAIIARIYEMCRVIEMEDINRRTTQPGLF